MNRALRIGVIAVAIASVTSAKPAPSLHGTGLGVLAMLAVACVAIALSTRTLPLAVEAALVALIGAAGVVLVALQPRGATSIVGAAAVWLAAVRLREPLDLAVAVAVTAALATTVALVGTSTSGLAATLLLCALLGVVGRSLRRERAARAAEERAAAAAERSRIAGDLHDVLAHSLSAAAIQLQAARLLAARDTSSSELQDAVDRAAELVRDGLAEARAAVGALRGEAPPGLPQLESLVDGFRRDARLPVTLRVEGDERRLPSESGLALYRGVQEALTNVARHAPGAATTVVVTYAHDGTTLCVDNALPREPALLAGVGGGRGLEGMRERVEHAGGRMHAGPRDGGWRVELELPA